MEEGCRAGPDPGHDVGVNLGITDTPAARRVTSPGWRDPRLWLGLAIVAASVLVGGLVLGTSDDTVPVWAAADPLGAGHVLTADDLAVRRVRFDDANAFALYFRADEQLPADLRLSRDVGAGELVPRAAVGPAAAGDLRQVPVSVPPDDTFGSDGTRRLVLGMSGGEAQRFFRLLASTDDAALTVVGRG